MNTTTPIRFRARLFATLLLLAAHPLAAQGVAAARANEKEDSARAEAAAKQLAKTGNVAGAEKVLTDRSKFKAGSTEWHRDAAQNVAKLADDLAREGQRTAVSALAASALQHLASADSPALSKPRRAALKVSAARVHEELRGDYAAAIAGYADAVSLDPTDRVAQEAHERLKAADDKLRGRIQAKRKS